MTYTAEQHDRALNRLAGDMRAVEGEAEQMKVLEGVENDLGEAAWMLDHIRPNAQPITFGFIKDRISRARTNLARIRGEGGAE